MRYRKKGRQRKIRWFWKEKNQKKLEGVKEFKYLVYMMKGDGSQEKAA